METQTQAIESVKQVLFHGALSPARGFSLINFNAQQCLWPVVRTKAGAKDGHLEVWVLPQQRVLPASDADCLQGARQDVHRRGCLPLWLCKQLPKVPLVYSFQARKDLGS